MRTLAELSQALLAVIAAIVVASPANARPVDVAARTGLQFDTFTDGLDVSVDGVLRDNNGSRLPRRAVVAAYTRAGQSVPALTESTRTDNEGAFRLGRRLQPGVWEISVAFEGDDFHAPATEAATVEAAPFETTLTIDAPATVGSEVTELDVTIVALAGATPAPDAWLDVSATCGAIEPVDETRWRLFWTERVAGCRIEAGLDGGVEAVPAAATALLRRVGAAQLDVAATWAAPTVFDAPAWRIDVQALDEHGPLQGLRVAVVADGEGSGQPLAEARTAEDGAAWLPVEGDLSAVRVVAHRDEPPATVATSAPIALESPARALRAVPLVASGLALLLLAGMIVGVVRDRRAAHPEVVAPPRPPAPGVREERAAAVADDEGLPAVVGVVLDAEWGTPLSATLTADDARVWRADGTGAFQLDVFEPIELLAEAPGYVPLRVLMRPPAPGRHLVVRLEAWRTRLLSLWREVVSDVRPPGVEPNAWWGRDTVHDVRLRTVAALRTLRREPAPDANEVRTLATRIEEALASGAPDAAADALGRLVAHRYFDGEIVGSEDIELAEQLARLVREGIA